MVVQLKDRKTEDALSRAERMVADFYWERDDVTVWEAADRLWSQFRFSPSEMKEAAIKGIMAGARTLITAYNRIGRIDPENGEAPKSGFHILGMRYVMADGRPKASADWNAEDLVFFEKVMRRESAGFQRRANWASVAHKKVVAAGADRLGTLPKIDLMELEEMWK